MTEYQPGTVAVATVRGVKGVRVMRDRNGWFSADRPDGTWFHKDEDLRSIRPCVVLGPETFPSGTEYAIEALRDSTESRMGTRGRIADQIEAQTKPARIPEPGLWGVVEASFCDPPSARFTLVHAAQGDRNWMVTDDGALASWSELVDPVLIREGLS